MNGDASGWMYLAACLLLPAFWGVCTAWFFGRLDRKLAPSSEGDTYQPPVDYSI